MSDGDDVLVEGPVVGERAPYGAPAPEVLAERGYVCEEFWLSGEATAYTHADDDGDAPARDGRWTARPFAAAPYRTRLLVLRPADPGTFTGTVFLDWQNVSAGYEQPAPTDGEVYRGHAWVGVSVQEAGLNGMFAGQGQRSGGAPLLDADPERYGDLVHPGEPACFDMFSDAARAVRRPQGEGADPMGGLPVARVVATGGSQSAMRLCAYANGIQPLHQVVDGFLLYVWEGRAPRMDAGPVPTYWQTTLRSDPGVPILVVNSEFEVTATRDLALDDSDRLRVWEVAGTAHGRRRVVFEPAEGEWGPNPLSWRPVHDGAMRALHDWLADGGIPSVQPRIAFTEGSWPSIERDSGGNAVGGVRLPEVAVPVAEYRGRKGGTGVAALYGGRRPYAPAVVRSRYGSREDYLDRWHAAVQELAAARVVVPEDVPGMLARGAEVAASLPLR